MSNHDNDILVVGAGISGTALAFYLVELGYSVTLVDNGVTSASSRVAAGLIKPVTGKRITVSWNAGEFVKHNDEFYPKLENLTGQSFYRQVDFIQIFKSISDRNEWLSRSSLEELKPFISGKHVPESKLTTVIAPYGSVYVNSCYWVDTSAFLLSTAEYLKTCLKFIITNINLAEIRYESDSIIWQESKYSKLIYCDGPAVVGNPIFDRIPFKPVKGEIVLVKLSGYKSDSVLGSGIHIIPVTDDKFLVGSTYDWDDLSATPTSKARESLIHKIKKLISCEVEVLDQFSGIRPAIQDRRPVAGFHNQFKNVGLFNGMGSKGYLMAPLLAKEFADHIKYCTPLRPEISIGRF